MIKTETKKTVRYICRCCKKECKSKLDFFKHLRQAHRRPSCLECNRNFKSWNHYTSHLIHCAKVIELDVELPQTLEHERNGTHTCQHCRRKYQKSNHLLNHQINRCIFLNTKIRIGILIQKFAFVKKL